MRDYRCLYLTANPILMSRRLFDPEYEYRIADWGGGYPRPFREIVGHTWKARERGAEDDTIVISEDPHLSKKALQEAKELKKVLEIKNEIDKEMKRREKIDKIFQEKIGE